jgi:PAS domain S-box-containing protein
MVGFPHSSPEQPVTRGRALFYAAVLNAGFAVLALVDPGSTKALLPVCVGASALVLLVAAVRERRAGKAGAELAATARQLAALVENAGDPILSASRDGTIRSWNLAAEQVLGYSASEIIGRNISILLPPESQPFVERRKEQIHSGEMVPLDETVLIAKGGERVAVSSRLAPLRDESGEIIGLAAFHRDIRHALRQRAEREALQQQLLQSQRLETVGQLAGGIAHDFNNLLAVILNYADFVRDELPDGSHVRDDVDEIYGAAERAAALTHQLLLFSRREVARPQVLDLNDVVTDTERLLGRTLGKNVELSTSLEDGLWPVMADAGQLEQVLMNLAVNARDAMPDGGTITIETGNAELEPGRYVSLSVTDTGSGMSPDVAAHAFEPFFTTKDRGEGTGLGLSTTYGIVEEAGGDIRIDSEEGRGTAVRVYLPAAVS